MLNKYHVVLEVDPKFQYGPEALNGIYVRSSTGQQMAPTARQQTPATLKSP
jgi:multidrug efflux pump subunit AcrB